MTPTENPRVSILIITYNNADYIEQCVQSALAQTYDFKEIIVVDDGSTDNTHEILEPYMDQIVYHYQENRGIAGARQTGHDLARGEFVNQFDGDDYFVDNEKIARQVALMDAQPTLAIVQSHIQYVTDDGDVISTSRWGKDGQIFAINDVVYTMSWNLQSSLIRRSWIDYVGGFISPYTRIEDFWVFMRMVACGARIGIDGHVTVAHRLYGTGDNHHDKYGVGVKSLIAVCQHLIDKNYFSYWSDKQLSDFLYNRYLNAAVTMSRSTKFDETIDYIQNAQRRSPPENHVKMLPIYVFDAGVYQSYIDRLPFDDLGKTIQQVIDWTGHTDVDAHLLTWWYEVWWYYHRLEVDKLDMTNLTRSREQHMDTLRQWYEREENIYKLAQRSLTLHMLQPSPHTLNILAMFCDDAQQIDSTSSHANCVTLYLTVMTRGVFAKEWGIVRASLWSAVKSSRTPGAILRWLRFGRSSLQFVLQKVIR